MLLFIMTKKREWTQTDLRDIDRSEETNLILAKKYDCSADQIRYQRRKSNKPINRWNTEEDDVLRKEYNSHSDKKIAEMLNRTEVAVLKRRHRLGLVKTTRVIDFPKKGTWSKEEKNFLIRNVGEIPLDDLRKELNRSESGIKTMIWRLGLYSKITSRSSWSKEEDKVLIEYRNEPDSALSFLLGRGVKGIRHRRKKLGINRRVSRSSIEESFKQILDDLNVEYLEQVRLGSKFTYRADFVLDKIVFELQGDYWHANPEIYQDPDTRQTLSIIRDKLKREYFESLGFIVLYIWESEFKTNPEKIKEQVAHLVGDDKNEASNIGEGLTDKADANTEITISAKPLIVS